MDLRLWIAIMAVLFATLSEAHEPADTVSNATSVTWINLHTPLSANYDLSIKIEADPPLNEVPRPLPDAAMQKWWWDLAKKGNLNLQDTSVVYPKFIKFCVDMYNWGDRFFNSYDPEYVVGTGKRWKVRILNDNWVDSYSMTLPGKLKTTI